jgi:hypothetical protein
MTTSFSRRNEGILGKYEYIALTCFGAPVAQVYDALKAAIDNTPIASTFKVHKAVLKLGNIYTVAPTPGATYPRKLVLYSPSSSPETTVFFANGEDGWYTIVISVSKRLPEVSCVRIVTSIQERMYPYNLLEIIEAGDSKRVILAYKDGDRWKCYQEGATLPFENAANYQRRRIADRLTRESITAYLAAINPGWDMRTSKFWSSHQPATYLNQPKTDIGREV